MQRGDRHLRHGNERLRSVGTIPSTDHYARCRAWREVWGLRRPLVQSRFAPDGTLVRVLEEFSVGQPC